MSAAPPAPAPASAPRALVVARIAAVLAVVALLALAHRFGLLAQVRDPERLRDTLVGLGAWGYLAFLVTYTVLQPFGVPGTVFVMVAPLIWPWPVAFALSMIGSTTASVVGFSFARFVARDWIARIIPARFRRWDDAIEKRGFVTVALLRFVFWMPQWLHALFGVSKVPFWTHFWGTVVGYLVPLFLVSYFGQQLFDWMRAAPLWVWIAMGAAIVAGWGGAWVWRRRARSRMMEP